MIFITTLTEQIYNICGKQLLQSFIDTNNHLDHQLYIFFEDKNNPHTEYYPEWLVEWSDRPFFTFINYVVNLFHYLTIFLLFNFSKSIILGF